MKKKKKKSIYEKKPLTKLEQKYANIPEAVRAKAALRYEGFNPNAPENKWLARAIEKHYRNEE